MFEVGESRRRREGTFGTDAHLVLGVVFKEALDTAAWELIYTVLI